MGRVVVSPPFVNAVEKRAEAVVIALLDRVILVVVAARALERHREKRRAKRMHAV